MIERSTAFTGPTFAVQRMHSSSPQPIGVAELEVSIMPLPLRSMHSATSPAIFTTVPCMSNARFATYASPLPSTTTRDGMLQPLLWQHAPAHSPAGRPTR